jgi:protein phosphatase
MKPTSQTQSHPGQVRSSNEDRYYASDEHGLYAVADGLGGAKAGEIASQTFADTVAAASPQFLALAGKIEREVTRGRDDLLRLVKAIFQDASRAIYERAQREASAHGMATTGVILGVCDGLAVIGSVGDSRAYLIRRGEVRLLTTDHTVFQKLLDHGLVTAERAAEFPYKNLLERSVGDLPQCQVDTFWLDIQPGDQFILCSDGVSMYLDPPRLRDLSRNDVNDVVDAANRSGGADNITIVSVKVGDDVPRLQLLDTDTRLRALNQLSVFRDLSFQEILQTMRIIHERRAAIDERVVAEGEPGDSMFVVVEGTLEVRREQTVLATLSAGDHFGDLAFLDGLPRSATVTALTPGVLLSLRRDDFQQLVRENPTIAAKMLTRFALSLAQRLRALDQDYVVRQAR